MPETFTDCFESFESFEFLVIILSLWFRNTIYSRYGISIGQVNGLVKFFAQSCAGRQPYDIGPASPSGLLSLLLPLWRVKFPYGVRTRKEANLGG